MAVPGTVASEVPPLCVPAGDITLGALVAEGGEGRVFEVRSAPAAWRGGGSPNRAELVYKQLRQPRPVAELEPTVSFLPALGAGDPGLASRVRSSCAWPVAVVIGDEPDRALGTLMPRAPEPFWLRHRAGGPRLASLSYLAGDPDRITVAYGAVVPAPGAADRAAVVYALARLLEAWQRPGSGARARDVTTSVRARAGDVTVAVHGDLSAKNVLWSLGPEPAVYVLDCDGAIVTTGGEGEQSGQRATTPNWDDPALAPGVSPTACSDRYILGLAFLRVVGAAHFPLQARQRAGEKVNVDLELPRSWRGLPDMPRLWALCERSLSLVDPASRPEPSEWAAALEDLLEAMGAGGLAARVRDAQGDPRPSRIESSTAQLASTAARDAGAPASRRSLGLGPRAGDVTVPDVTVHLVIRHRVASTWRLVNPSAAPNDTGEGFSGLGLAAGLGPRQVLSRCARTWAGAHRLALRLLRSRGRRADGLRRLVRVLVLDVAAACVVLFLVAEMVSPWIGL